MKSTKLRGSAGFTLIEVMVVVMIMGIILAFGIPAFGELIDKTRVRSAAETVVEAFRVARLTAVQDRASVNVCPWNSDGTCSGNDWDQGIMVVNSKNEVIYRMRFNETLFVWKNQPENDKVTINPNGWTPGEMSSLYICAEQGNGKNAYRLTISMAGKITPSSLTDPSKCDSAG